MYWKNEHGSLTANSNSRHNIPTFSIPYKVILVATAMPVYHHRINGVETRQIYTWPKQKLNLFERVYDAEVLHEDKHGRSIINNN